MAFELGAGVNEALERAINEQRRVRRHFQTAYNALAADARRRIVERLGGVPAVFVGFAPGTPPGRWRRAVAPVLQFLVARVCSAEDACLRAGDVPVSQVPGLSPILTEMTIRAAPTAKPFFGVIEAVEVVDATLHMLTKKLASRYRSEAPVELLLYWTATPAPRAANWRDAIIACIRGQRASPFRRIWCFDLFQRAVVAVHPEPPAHGHFPHGP